MYSIFKEKLYNVFSRIFKVRKAYAIGYRFNNDGEDFSIHKELPYTVIMPTKGEWYADPFPYIKDGKHYIFAEIMNEENSGRGTLGVTCLESDGGVFKEILSEPFHLSFPNVFEIHNKIYMIPETNQANQMRLYEAVKFPDVWKLKSVLLQDICCVDTAVYIKGEEIYLTTHDWIKRKNRYFQWDYKTEILNEIEMMSESYLDRRPAGNFIQYSNGVYHALQNCDGVYGKHLHMAKVDRFDKTGLYEKEEGLYTIKDVTRKNKKIFNRIHTFNRIENFEVIDLHLYQINFNVGGAHVKKYSL